MYEQKTINNSDIKLFGIKIFERMQENTDIFEREFISDEDTQALIESRSCIEFKLFGIIIAKLDGCTKYNENTIEK